LEEAVKIWLSVALINLARRWRSDRALRFWVLLKLKGIL